MDAVFNGVLMPIINPYSVYDLVFTSIIYLKSSAF